jgi:hypothetical protein
MAEIAQIWILPDVLFSDLEFLTFSENEQRQRFDYVTNAVKAGDVEYLQSIPWVSLLDPNDPTEGGVH